MISLQCTHRFYNSLHLARWEKKELNKRMKETHNITAAAAMAGIDPATYAIKRSIRNINKVLGNYGRATFEINRSKIQQGIVSSTNDVLAEFEDLDKRYPEFIGSAQILSSKFFVSFCSPEMVKGELPFAGQPIITEVTYKAVPKGYYLCLSVIYMRKIDKHVVFVQAIIKSNNTQIFQQYFIALFKKFDIKPEKFLGMVVDFSAAQRKGFLLAFHQVFGLKAHNALPFLKGCYMHWMQSVK